MSKKTKEEIEQMFLEQELAKKKTKAVKAAEEILEPKLDVELYNVLRDETPVNIVIAPAANLSETAFGIHYNGSDYRVIRIKYDPVTGEAGQAFVVETNRDLHSSIEAFKLETMKAGLFEVR